MDGVGTTYPPRRRSLRALASVALLAVVAACGTRQAAVAPGYYRVRRGDTLTQIARRSGHSVADLRRWNRLSNANRIQVGQILRVAAPGGVASTASRTTLSRPAPARPAAPKPTQPPRPAAPPRITLVQPAQGHIIETYNGSSSRGLTITNAVGTPVVAAAAGSVMYAGDGLRAYGNLIIIEHSANYLTIYAHNQKLLVSVGQKVAQGQRIAEMGATGSHRVALYFEVRRNGQALDPSGLFK